jgi:hypothetical protein
VVRPDVPDGGELLRAGAARDAAELAGDVLGDPVGELVEVGVDVLAFREPEVPAADRPRR